MISVAPVQASQFVLGARNNPVGNRRVAPFLQGEWDSSAPHKPASAGSTPASATTFRHLTHDTGNGAARGCAMTGERVETFTQSNANVNGLGVGASSPADPANFTRVASRQPNCMGGLQSRHLLNCGVTPGETGLTSHGCVAKLADAGHSRLTAIDCAGRNALGAGSIKPAISVGSNPAAPATQPAQGTVGRADSIVTRRTGPVLGTPASSPAHSDQRPSARCNAVSGQIFSSAWRNKTQRLVVVRRHSATSQASTLRYCRTSGVEMVANTAQCMVQFHVALESFSGSSLEPLVHPVKNRSRLFWAALSAEQKPSIGHVTGMLEPLRVAPHSNFSLPRLSGAVGLNSEPAKGLASGIWGYEPLMQNPAAGTTVPESTNTAPEAFTIRVASSGVTRPSTKLLHQRYEPAHPQSRPARVSVRLPRPNDRARVLLRTHQARAHRGNGDADDYHEARHREWRNVDS